MKKIVIESKKPKEIIDITDEINKIIKEKSIKNGFCHLFLLHTTSGLTTVYLDPESELSMMDAFQSVIPKSISPDYKEFKYDHTHITISLPDHIIASYIGPSLSIPIENEKLMLGKYQRVALIELNGPRKREIVISF